MFLLISKILKIFAYFWPTFGQKIAFFADLADLAIFWPKMTQMT
jgi:hypothetical protein